MSRRSQTQSQSHPKPHALVIPWHTLSRKFLDRFCCFFGDSKKIPASKMQKISPNTGASSLLLYSVACAGDFGRESLFHPSGSIEKPNCTMRFWGLKGSWSIHRSHRGLTQKSVSSVETSRAIRIVRFHDKPTDNWQSHPDGKTEGQGYPTHLMFSL